MSENFFLKIDGVEGDARDPNHKGEIAVLSWSHSFNQPASPTRSSSGGAVEQANHADFSFVKYVDGASMELLRRAWSGQQSAKVVFTAYRADGDNRPARYLLIEFSHVIVSNLSISGGAGDLPTETVTLSYGTVQYTYFRSSDDRKSVKHDMLKQTVS